MSVNGISQAPLYKKATEGDVTTVPIGQTILTNDVALNSPDVQVANTGAEIESLDLGMFESFGGESLRLVREDGSSTLNYKQRTAENTELTKEIHFDKESGVLSIVKYSGKIISVSGFLTQKDFGVGPMGPQGDRGKDGPDGDDGEHGKPGEPGCPGAIGPTGPVGVEGLDDGDGEPGDEGDMGADGEEGVQGPMGPEGVFGFEGSRGFRGDGCSEAKAGAPGAAGQAVNTRVVISSAEPDNLSVLWGKP